MHITLCILFQLNLHKFLLVFSLSCSSQHFIISIIFSLTHELFRNAFFTIQKVFVFSVFLLLIPNLIALFLLDNFICYQFFLLKLSLGLCVWSVFHLVSLIFNKPFSGNLTYIQENVHITCMLFSGLLQSEQTLVIIHSHFYNSSM